MQENAHSGFERVLDARLVLSIIAAGIIEKRPHSISGIKSELVRPAVIKTSIRIFSAPPVVFRQAAFLVTMSQKEAVQLGILKSNKREEMLIWQL